MTNTAPSDFDYQTSVAIVAQGATKRAQLARKALLTSVRGNCQVIAAKERLAMQANDSTRRFFLKCDSIDSNSRDAMNKTKFAYTGLTVLLLLAMVYFFAKGLSLKPESFGLGLSYILPGVVCLGMAIVSGIMALLESAAGMDSTVASSSASSS